MQEAQPGEDEYEDGGQTAQHVDHGADVGNLDGHHQRGHEPDGGDNNTPHQSVGSPSYTAQMQSVPRIVTGKAARHLVTMLEAPSLPQKRRMG